MKLTRRAILLMAALVLCFTAMIGSTVAWFTDTVESNANTIQAGNLDMVVEYKTSADDEWAPLTESVKLFKENALYEPGYTEIVHFRVSNAGSLSFKYNFGIDVNNETTSTNVAGEEFSLKDYLEVGCCVMDESLGQYLLGTMFGTRESAISHITGVNGTGFQKISALDGAIYKDRPLVKNANYCPQLITLVLTMPETVGNEANHKAGVAAPSITLGVNVMATQLVHEKDSFGADYDIDAEYPAPAVVTSLEDLKDAMDDNKDVLLRNYNNAETTIVIPEAYTGTLTLENTTINAIEAEDAANVKIKGNVVVMAKSGSAITGKEINLSGAGTLTAIAADAQAAFGIGGMNTEKITVKDITIKEVRGGYDGQIGTDTKYYKDAPEGGSAIGSGYNGAVIELDNVHIEKAVGGSKAAGIGARYHVGVTVTIKNSDIAYVEGGATAAGIGGSRFSGDANENGTTIHIINSTITAKGGVYAAGIGSGYDTHCSSSQPLCTINIDDSTINAAGGQYAAGVGTGYHNAALAGEIKNSTINAVSGEKFYKASYTQAQDVGFGVVDPAREGQQTGSKLICNGTTIGIPAVQ